MLRNYRMLSTERGERFAMVTAQNQLNSKQILDREEFVGIFADGTRRYPRELDVAMDPSRTRTFILEFGHHPFPLVKVIIENG